MEVKEIKAKSIASKTKLGSDFVINPYVGCMHGCKYCYARFMKRFTGHKEAWGTFMDVKVNGPELITDKYKGKSILFGSVTDAYNPLERKYKLTRRILEKLLPLQPEIEIITKSDLIVRDLDLLKRFKKCTIVCSLSFLDEDVRIELEPLASPAENRIKALKEIRKKGIKNVVFISPIFPKLTDWKKIISKTKDFVDEYWFENLNLYPAVRESLREFLEKNGLMEFYKQVYKTDYWGEEEKEIRAFCKKNKVKYKIYFHHTKR